MFYTVEIKEVNKETGLYSISFPGREFVDTYAKNATLLPSLQSSTIEYSEGLATQVSDGRGGSLWYITNVVTRNKDDVKHVTHIPQGETVLWADDTRCVRISDTGKIGIYRAFRDSDQNPISFTPIVEYNKEGESIKFRGEEFVYTSPLGTPYGMMAMRRNDKGDRISVREMPFNDADSNPRFRELIKNPARPYKEAKHSSSTLTDKTLEGDSSYELRVDNSPLLANKLCSRPMSTFASTWLKMGAIYDGTGWGMEMGTGVAANPTGSVASIRIGRLGNKDYITELSGGVANKGTFGVTPEGGGEITTFGSKVRVGETGEIFIESLINRVQKLQGMALGENIDSILRDMLLWMSTHIHPTPGNVAQVIPPVKSVPQMVTKLNFPATSVYSSMNKNN